MPNKFKPLEKIEVKAPKDDFKNGQIKEALVRIADLKAQTSDLKKEIESLKQRLKLFEGHLK